MIDSHHQRRGLSTLHIVLIAGGAIVIVFGCALAGMAALLLPALTKARTNASELRSEMQIRELLIAAEMLALDQADSASEANADNEPPSVYAIGLDELINDGYISSYLLDSPFDTDGLGDDYWVYPGPFDTTLVNPTGRMIVVYDREMYATHDTIAVGFADGQADVVTLAEFQALLRSPANAQTDLQLPRRVK